jgi:hypothetical protein
LEAKRRSSSFQSVELGDDLMLDHACGLVVTLHLLPIASLSFFSLRCKTIYICEAEQKKAVEVIMSPRAFQMA